VKARVQILSCVIPSPVARFWRRGARDLLLGSRRFVRSAITIGLIAVISLSAQAPEPIPLAHGNVPGEPHHHLKIENEFVRVYYVEVPPHENTQLHQHDHDYIYVSLGPSDVVNAPLNKPEVHLTLKDGETHFTRGGFAHVARNLSDAPFRNITIELLKPQGEPRNLCETVIINAPLNDCEDSGSASPPADSPLRMLARAVAVKPIFRTDKAAVKSFSISLKQNYTETDAQHPRLLVVEDRSEVKVEIAGEASQSVQDGGVLWLAPGKKWAIVSLGGQKTARFLLIEFRE